MPNIAVGDIMQLTIRGSQAAQTTLSILHYRVITAPTPGGVIQSQEAFAAAVTAGTGNLLGKYLDCISNDWGLRSVDTQIIYPTRYVKSTKTSIVDGGHVTANALPVANTVSITKQGLEAGRHSIGGLRMPGVPTTFALDSLLNGTGRPKYQILADRMLDNVVDSFGTIYDPIIFDHASPTTSKAIENTTVKDEIRTMSRRVVGRGI